MDLKPLFFVFILTALLLTPGCNEPNTITPPFTTNQFVRQATDLNYIQWKLGDYNNMVLVFDGNKIGVADANDLNVATPDLSGYVPYTGATADVNLGYKDLVVYEINDLRGHNNIVADGRLLYDSVNHPSLDWNTRILDDLSGSSSIQWGNRFLIDSAGNLVASWDGNFKLSRNMNANGQSIYAVKDVNATRFFGDGSQLTNLPSTDVNWCVGEKDDDAVPQWDADLNCYVKATLSAGGGGSWFNSLPYSNSLSNYVFSYGWGSYNWDTGFDAYTVDSSTESSGFAFWLEQDMNVDWIATRIGTNTTVYGDINLVIYDTNFYTGYPTTALCWTNTTIEGSVVASNFSRWKFSNCFLEGKKQYVFSFWNKNATPTTKKFQTTYLVNYMQWDSYSNLQNNARIYTTNNGSTWYRGSPSSNWIIWGTDGNFLGIPLNSVGGSTFGQYGVTWWSPNFKIVLQSVHLGLTRSGSYVNVIDVNLVDVNGTFIARSTNQIEGADISNVLGMYIFHFDNIVLDANHGYIFVRNYASGTANGVGIPSAMLYNWDANVIKTRALLCGDYRCGYPYKDSIFWANSHRYYVAPITAFWKLYVGDTSDSVPSVYSGVS